MAYTQFVPSGFSEFLAQLALFCSESLGWTASYDGDDEVTVIPKPGEATFTLRVNPPGTYGAQLRCDVVKGDNSFYTQATHISGIATAWLFGGQSPEPWCHIVLNTVPGQYRHLYFGYMERYGDWSCGAIADANVWTDYVGNREDPADENNGMLFSQARYTSASGGVIIESEHASKPLARFGKSSGGNSVPSDYAALRGGWLDSDNRRLIEPGTALHSGMIAMAPALILADFGRDDFWTPLGVAPGVRMVNIQDLNPEEVIAFGASDWQVFPLSDKHRSTNFNDWPETGSDRNTITGGSGHLGVAVLRA